MLSTMFRNGKPTKAHNILTTLNRLGEADSWEMYVYHDDLERPYLALRKLFDSGLIEIVGKTEGVPGGPFRYSLTWRGRELARTLERIT